MLNPYIEELPAPTLSRSGSETKCVRWEALDIQDVLKPMRKISNNKRNRTEIVTALASWYESAIVHIVSNIIIPNAMQGKYSGKEIVVRVS